MEVNSFEPFSQRARTKIVATVGPACRSPEMLARLSAAGTDVYRLNMAHGSQAEHESTLRDIRQVSQDARRPIGVLVDLAGPKIRLGTLSPDPLECPAGHEFRFVRGESSDVPGELTSIYEPLVDELEMDDRVLLADGTVAMRVIAKDSNSVTCRVTSPGTIRSRQGINLPGVKLSAPAMSDEDIDNARWAARAGADFISLSFVRSPVEVYQLREIIRRENSRALVIAKIEKPEALDELDAIVDAADGIMVARGDLGVEIDVAEMPLEQKRIIETCQKFRKPVIVATQMLDSMQRSSTPTRAEATDVANAILDGADACMLSGETAIGRFPRESVEMMNRIMLATEQRMKKTWQPRSDFQELAAIHPVTSAIVYGAGVIADQLSAKIVVVATRSGATALTKAKYRDFIPTVAVSDSEETLRQTTLYWGINPISGAPSSFATGLTAFVDEWGRTNGSLHEGDQVVFVGGTGLEGEAHNLIFVHEIGE